MAKDRRRERLLNQDDVSLIKNKLFYGTRTQAELAESYLCTPATISAISTGRSWGHVPWPDGSFGEMPEAAKAARRARRREENTASYSLTTTIPDPTPEFEDSPELVIEISKIYDFVFTDAMFNKLLANFPNDGIVQEAADSSNQHRKAVYFVYEQLISQDAVSTATTEFIRETIKQVEELL